MNIKSIFFALFLICGALFLDAQAQSGYGYSYIEYMPANQTVYAETGTVLDYYFAYYYDPGIQPFLYEDNNLVASSERTLAPGYSSISAYAQVTADPRKTYRIQGDHYVGAYFYQIVGGQPRYLDYYGLGFYSGSYPSPYGFLQGPTAFYYYRVYKVATTTVQIQVPQPPPQISIDSTGAVPGQPAYLSGLRGSNLFGQNQSIQVSGNGVTMTVQPTNPNEIEFLDIEIEVAEDAQVGERDVTLTVDGQTSNTVKFRVGDRTPQITNITPPEGNTGDQVGVTITGSNFGFNPIVRIGGTGVSQTITSSTTTEINAVFSVADATYIGSRSVQVVSRGVTGMGFVPVLTNSDTSNPVNFDVLAPVVTINDVPLIEKNGEQTVNVSVSGLVNNDDVKFTLKPLSGATGEARFDNNSNEIRKGNGQNQTLTIKGITESSDVNKMTIEATPTNASNVLDHKEFTIATITSLVFERINSDDVALDNNPGTDGIVNLDGSEGMRIFPDKNNPAETTDRSILRVKATVSPSVPNMKVYFASFDLDDPSANSAPIDPLGSDGNDNNGAVNGSKSGEFSNPAGGSCANASAGTSPAYISKIECMTSGTATSTNFRTTMQPGDNFAIAATLVDAYRNTIKVDPSAGTNLINSTNQVLPISGEANSNNVQGIRTTMLTVWRRLHLEVDSMGSVDDSNNTVGTITGVRQLSDPNCTPNQTPPCYQTFTVYDVNTTPQLEIERFQNGRIKIGLKSYNVYTNGPNVIALKGTPNLSGKVPVGSSFILYDDDDYNADDPIVDGDFNEQIVRLPESFKYVSDADGLYPDGKPKNLYASAYIKPEYNWAEGKNYNQTNLSFNLNVSDASVAPLINANRNSANDERDDFWIGYLLIAYQGPSDADGDGESGAVSGTGPPTTLANICDCYQSSSCVGSSCAIIPKGVQGNLIYQEVMQDAIRSFLSIGISTSSIGTTVPHELGHQFGLDGDNRDPVTHTAGARPVLTYQIMDYPHYRNGETDNYGFHPEHINLMRRRVKSPGE